MRKMNTKVAIVTGANKGIGYAIVRGLCKRFEGIVYLTSRNETLGKEAVEKLNAEGLKPIYHQLDITDDRSIKRFTENIKENHGHIDILVNNAAIAFKFNATESRAVQAEETLRVNYFSVVNVCEHLFPLLRDGARVINISSSAGHLNNIPCMNLREEFKNPSLTIPELSGLMEHYIEAAKLGVNLLPWGESSYAVSKVGLTALTFIQQRLLEHRNIKVNAVHPGYVNTDMSSHRGQLTIDQGAEAPLYLALDAPDSVKGQYVWFDKRIVKWDENNS